MTTNLKLKKKKIITAADLFCGAGGTSTGFIKAVESLDLDFDLVAVNHWDVAISTHKENHKEVEHYCQSIDTINPQEVIPGGRLNLLMASPECTDHSNAKGGKPRSDQKRADAWLLMRWIEKLYVENLIIENVKEFVNWGPLNAKGLPDKRYRGQYFRQFVEALKINYSVEWKILNAADYGDATTRERFFLIAKRGKNKKIVFPAPTHASRKVLDKNQPNLFSNGKTLKPWRSAREIIDWDLEGKSIFNRKRPLSENTMRRIFAGLFKYGLKPFTMGTGGPTGQMRPRDIDEPVRTILTDHRQNVFVPYLINLKASDRRMREIDEPTFTQTTANHQYLAEPFLVNLSHTKNNDAMMCKPLEEPLKTICGKAMLGLIEPFLVKFYGGADAESVDDPIPTITANYEHYGLAETEAFILPNEGFFRGNTAREIDEPIPTVTSRGGGSVVEPFMIQFFGERKGQKPRTKSVDDPLWTVTAQGRMGIAEPFLVRFNNNQGAEDIDEPLKTLTTKDRYGLCIPQIGAVLDIRFRMLQPHELAAAMSFPKSYSFTGTRQDKVKQIGNAVPVNLAKNLVKAVLDN